MHTQTVHHLEKSGNRKQQGMDAPYSDCMWDGETKSEHWFGGGEQEGHGEEFEFYFENL